jgi:hypothetical protein
MNAHARPLRNEGSQAATFCDGSHSGVEAVGGSALQFHRKKPAASSRYRDKGILCHRGAADKTKRAQPRAPGCYGFHTGVRDPTCATRVESRKAKGIEPREQSTTRPTQWKGRLDGSKAGTVLDQRQDRGVA